MSTAVRKAPITKGHWLLKSSLDVVRDPLGFIEHWHAKLGDIFEIATITHPVYMISDPDVARYILQENHRNFHKSFDYEILALALGQGLLTNEGESWLRQRRLAQPAFHRQRLVSLYEVMADETRQLVERWDAIAEKGETVSLSHELMRVAMRIVGRALFGTDVGPDTDRIGEQISLVNEHLSKRAVNPFLAPDFIPTPRNVRFHRSLRKLDEAIYKIIRSRKGDSQRDDLLAMLMDARDEETGEGMSEKQLRDEVMTLFIAGHETSATALSWAFYELMRHPEALAILREEVDSLAGDGIPSHADLSKMPWTDQVLQEAMRLHPPAYVVGRRNYKPDVLGGYPVPAETNVIITTWLIHRDPRWWEKPEEFYPEHFSEERIKAQPKYTYFPFGGGPRICIGNHFAMQEMQLLLSVLSNRYDLELMGAKVVERDPLVTMRPKGGIPIRIRRR